MTGRKRKHASSVSTTHTRSVINVVANKKQKSMMISIPPIFVVHCVRVSSLEERQQQAATSVTAFDLLQSEDSMRDSDASPHTFVEHQVSSALLTLWLSSAAAPDLAIRSTNECRAPFPIPAISQLSVLLDMPLLIAPTRTKLWQQNALLHAQHKNHQQLRHDSGYATSSPATASDYQCDDGDAAASSQVLGLSALLVDMDVNPSTFGLTSHHPLIDYTGPVIAIRSSGEYLGVTDLRTICAFAHKVVATDLSMCTYWSRPDRESYVKGLPQRFDYFRQQQVPAQTAPTPSPSFMDWPLEPVRAGEEGLLIVGEFDSGMESQGPHESPADEWVGISPGNSVWEESSKVVYGTLGFGALGEDDWFSQFADMGESGISEGLSR